MQELAALLEEGVCDSPTKPERLVSLSSRSLKSSQLEQAFFEPPQPEAMD